MVDSLLPNQLATTRTAYRRVKNDPVAAGGLAATLDDGTRVSAEAFRRLSGDAALVPFHQLDRQNPLKPLP
jgi:hypothetical protein